MPVLYKNSENKVLLSIGGRIIKQPYNFGKWFMSRVGLNNYIKIANLSLSANSHIAQWVDTTNSATSIYIPYYNCKYGSDNIAFSLYVSGTSTYTAGLAKNSAISTPTYRIGTLLYSAAASMLPNTPVGVIIRNDLSVKQANGVKIVNSTSTVANNAWIDEIWLGAYRPSSGTTPTVFAPNTTKYNLFAVFDRELADSEFAYLYANGLGSELLSTVGCSILLLCDKAEILDFSVAQDGSDMRVGVRDYSGYNRHGEIMNLPAGTNQYKVDYANSNLFV